LEDLAASIFCPEVLWQDTNILEDLAASIFYPEDGGSKVLRNVGILRQHYTASQP
jgi:hypothetical protein